MGKTDKQKHQAFLQFVRERQAQLRGFLRLIGVRPDSIDDLAQETFLIAFRELDNYAADVDIGKWLNGIARNLARNEMRKSVRRSRILNNQLTDHLLDQADQGESQFEEADFRALRDCMANLPEKSRQLMFGRYGDEWKSSFLADQFQMTANAVRQTLLRIRRQLKTCIDERLNNA